MVPFLFLFLSSEKHMVGLSYLCAFFLLFFLVTFHVKFLCNLIHLWKSLCWTLAPGHDPVHDPVKKVTLVPKGKLTWSISMDDPTLISRQQLFAPGEHSPPPQKKKRRALPSLNGGKKRSPTELPAGGIHLRGGVGTLLLLLQVRAQSIPPAV